MLLSVLGHTPEIGSGSYIAPSADIIGKVKIGRDCSIWFNCTLRGDIGPITIGDETNIQDNSVIHGTYNKAHANIGHRVTIGHSVIMHGCDIGDLVLVGMGSVIMDNAKIPRLSIVGAGSLITENATFEEGYLIMGRPAKAVRKLKPEEIKFLDKSADNYLMYKKWYQDPSQRPPADMKFTL